MARRETVLVETARYGHFPVRVERLIPPRYAAYPLDQCLPWRHARTGQLHAGRVHPDGAENGVLVRVKESGFAGLLTSPEIRAARHADNVRGWTSQLDLLRQASETSAPVTRDMTRSLDEFADIFAALADSNRRSVLEHLVDAGEGTATTLAVDLPFSRQAVVKHLAHLERAQLVRSPAPGQGGALPGAFRAASRHRPGHRRDRRRLGPDPLSPQAIRRGDGSPREGIASP